MAKFTFSSAVEAKIIATATRNVTRASERDVDIFEMFLDLGYDNSKRNIPGAQWERLQHVYASTTAALSGNTLANEKKAFSAVARKLGYGKLQTAAAKAKQAERAANRPAKADTAESATYGKATQQILAAIIAGDANGWAAARALLTPMVPAKALSLTAKAA